VNRKVQTAFLCILFTVSAYGSVGDFSVKRVRIYGAQRTRTDVLMRRLGLVPGSIYSIEDLREMKQFCMRELFVKSVEFYLKPSSYDTACSLLLHVTDRGIFSVDPVIGDNDVFGIYGGAGVTLTNALGFGSFCKVLVQKGGINKYGFEAGNNWFGPKALFSAVLCVSSLDYPYRFTDVESDAVLTVHEYSGTIGVHLSKEASGSVEFLQEYVEFGDPAVMASGTCRDVLKGLTVTGTIDTRDWHSYPAQGVFASCFMAWRSVQHREPFIQYQLEMRNYSTLTSGSILALRFRIHMSQGTVPFYKRVHYGGGRTLRGFRTGSIYGDSGFLMSAELRKPLLYVRRPFSGMHIGFLGVLFIDTGTAWFTGRETQERTFHAAVGTGIHAVLDNIVLRAEYGYQGRGIGFVGLGTGVMF